MAEPQSEQVESDSFPEHVSPPVILLRFVSQCIRALAIGCIRLYQMTAPIRPKMCRYIPTCSEYTAQSIREHGIFAGVAYGIRRILRCNPFSPGGYDPIPPHSR